MYKVGDKLLCKKGYKWINGDVFTKGKYYNVISEDSKLNFKVYGITLIDDEGDQHLMFQDEVIEYFYTKEELRKLKLEKLNG